MAATPAGRRLTEAHRRQQIALGRAAVVDLAASFKLLDPSNVDRTSDRCLAAGGYMLAFRRAELGATFTPKLAGAAAAAAVTTSLLVTGPINLKLATARGVEFGRAIEQAVTAVGKSGMRHVLDGGRDTIQQTVQADKRALGVGRAVSGSPCHFCAMLASRGPVYKTEDSAGFEPHDGCHCEPEPVYSEDAPWAAGADKYRDLWATSTAGLGGDDAMNAFRRALAGE